MSTTYTQSTHSGSIIGRGGLALLVTAAIFALIPILQIIPNLFTGFIDPTSTNTAQEIAPIVIEPVPDRPEEKDKLEKPKLEKPTPKLTIHELAILLSPGMGGVGSSSIAIDTVGLIDPEVDITIFDIKDLDRKPHALFQTEPVYPYSLKQQKIEGWVIIEWIISETGRVMRSRVIQSSHREFQQPALDSISSSKWKPGEISGKAVNSRVRQKITFSL